jgi:hypothetical protein
MYDEFKSPAIVTVITLSALECFGDIVIMDGEEK